MAFWKDLSVRGKIVFAYGLPSLATCALGLFGLAQTAKINDAGMVATPAALNDFGLDWPLDLVLALPVLLSAGMGILMVRTVAAPLGRVAEAMSRLSAGDLEIGGGDTVRGDEIGALAHCLCFFKEEALRAAALAAAEEEGKQHRSGHLETLTEQLSDFEDQLTSVLTILTAVAGNLQSRAERVDGRR